MAPPKSSRGWACHVVRCALTVSCVAVFGCRDHQPPADPKIAPASNRPPVANDWGELTARRLLSVVKLGDPQREVGAGTFTGSVRLSLSGQGGGVWVIDFSGAPRLSEGAGKADCAVSMSAESYVKLARNELSLDTLTAAKAFEASALGAAQGSQPWPTKRADLPDPCFAPLLSLEGIVRFMHGEATSATRAFCADPGQHCIADKYASRAECELDLATSRRVARQLACETSFDATFECEASHSSTCTGGVLRPNPACLEAFRAHRACRENTTCGPFTPNPDASCDAACVVSGFPVKVHCAGNGALACSCEGAALSTPTFNSTACSSFEALHAFRRGSCRPQQPLGWTRQGLR